MLSRVLSLAVCNDGGVKCVRWVRPGVVLLTVAVFATASSCTNDQHLRASNDTLVSRYDRTANGCADVANAEQAASASAVESVALLTGAELVAAHRAQHARNHQFAAAVHCLFDELDRLLPLPPRVYHAEELPAAGVTNVICADHHGSAPSDVVNDLAAARQWWGATADRLARTAVDDVDAAFDVWADLSGNPSRVPRTDVGPVYSGTAQQKAWLTFDPVDGAFSVSAPTTSGVDAYCSTLG